MSAPHPQTPAPPFPLLSGPHSLCWVCYLMSDLFWLASAPSGPAQTGGLRGSPWPTAPTDPVDQCGGFAGSIKASRRRSSYLLAITTERSKSCDDGLNAFRDEGKALR